MSPQSSALSSLPLCRWRRQAFLGRAITAAVLVAAVPGAWSATVSWVGGQAVDPHWEQAANWSLAVPTAADDVLFPTSIPPVPGSTITLGAGETAKSLTFRNTYTLTGGTLAVAGGTITVAESFTATIDSVLTGSSALTLALGNALLGPDEQAGGGTLVLGGANSAFTGAITVSSGVLRLASAAALGANSANTTVSSGATLDLNGQTASENLVVASTGVGGNGALINTSSTAATVNGTVASGTYSVGGTGDITLNGQAASSASTLTKLGANTLTLTGTQDNISLAATVNAGTLALAKSSSASVHAIGGGVTVNGGRLQLAGTGGDQIFQANTVTMNGGTFDLNGRDEGFNVLAGTSGVVTNDGATVNTLTLGQTNGSGTFGGTIVANQNAGTGDIALTKAGTGTLTLTGANSFGGKVKIEGGAISVNSISNPGGGASALGAPQSAASAVIDLGSSATVGTLLYTGPGTTLERGFNLAGTTFGGGVENNGSGALIISADVTASGLGAKTFTIGGSSAAANQNALNGIISDSAGGPTGLTKSGASTWVLSGANTYSGATTVTSGSLFIAPGGSVGVAGVAAGGLSVGVGAVGSLVVQAGGDLRVGSGPASTLDVGIRTGATTLTDGLLDVSALGDFVANVGQVRLGVETGSGNGNSQRGVLLLATNNAITASTQILIGDSPGNGNAVVSRLQLGAGSNNFVTPLVTVGGRKSEGEIRFAHSGGTWTLDNGAGATNLYVARNNTGTGTFNVGTVDLTGGTFIARLGTFSIGDKSDGGAGSGGATGTFVAGSSSANNVTADVVTIGSLAGGTAASAIGSGALTWNGGSFTAGSVALGVKGAGLGTATGTFTINGGTVVVSGGITDGGGASALTLQNGTLDLQGSAIGSMANPIDALQLNAGTLANVGGVNGPAGLAKNTPGVLTLAGTNTYAGGTFVSVGTLRLGNPNALPASGTVTVSGGRLDTGTGSMPFGALILTGGAIGGSADLAGSSYDLREGVITANLTGAAGVIKTTAGAVTLLGENTYTGGTALNAGTLLISRNVNLGAPSSPVIFNGGTVGWVRGSVADITAGGRTFTLNSDARLDTNGNDIVFNSPLSSGLEAGGLVKLGDGTLTFAGGNSYAGPTVVERGVLRFTGSYGLADAAPVVVQTGATLDLASSSDETIASLAGGGSVMVAGGQLTFGAAAADATFAGTLSGLTGLTKSGTGTQTLTGSSSFDAPVRVNLGGVLAAAQLNRGGQASSIGASASAAANLVLDGGTFRYAGDGANTDRLFTLTENSGTLDASGRGTVFFTATGAVAFTGAGDRTLTLAGTTGGNLFGSGAGSSTLAGLIGNGPGGVTSVQKNGPGVWQLSGVNTYTGASQIAGGTLVVNNLKNGGTASNLGQSGNDAASLVIDGGALRYIGGAQTTDRSFTIGTAGATLESSGTGALSFNSTSPSNAVVAAGNGTRELTLTGGTAGALNLQLSDPLIGQLALTKNGANTWTLTRAGAGLGGNTYTGATTVNQGTLALNFAPANSPVANLIGNSSALVLGGGILAINGAGGAAVNSQTFASTTLSRGDSTLLASHGAAATTGSLTIDLGPLQVSAGATVDFALGANASAANTIFLTNTGTADSLLTASNGAVFATYNAGDWAAKNTANNAIVAGSTLAGFYTPTTASTLAGNADVAAGIDTVLAVDTGAASLRFNRAEARTITVGGGNALTLPGVLVTATTGNNLSRIIGGGTLRGVAGGGLTIFQNNTTNALQIDAIIADNGGATPLVKAGGGVLVLRGANTYGGTTFLHEGTLRLGTDTALGSGSLQVENGGVLSVLASDGTTARQLANNLWLNADVQLGDSTGTGGLIFTGGVDLGAGMRTVTSNNTQVTFNGAVSNGTLVKAGGNTLQLANLANTYAGGTYLTAGNLDVNGTGSLGTGPLFISGGTLSSFGLDTRPITTPLLVSGNFTLGRGGISTGIDLGGSVDLLNGVRTIGVAGTQQRISGVISNGGLTKNNSSELILSGINTYAGGTTIQNGSLLPQTIGALGADVVGNNVSVNPGGGNQNPVLRLTRPDFFGSNQQLILNNSRTDAPAALALGAAFGEGGGNTVNFSNSGAGLQNIRIQNNNANFLAIYLDGIRSGEDFGAKIAAIAPSAPVWLGATGATGVYTGATLAPGVGSLYRLGGGGGTLTIEKANVLSGSNGLVVGSPDTTARGLSGTVYIPEAQSFTGNITVGSGGNLTVGSNASLGAATNAITLGGSTLELRVSGAHGNVDSQYAGRTITMTNSSTIAISPRGGLQLATVEIGALNVTGGSRNVAFTAASNSNLAVTGASTFSGTGSAFTVTFNPALNQSNYLSFNAPITEANGALSLRMNANAVNAPTLVLAADNTYSGQTQVTRGTLVLANTGAAGSPGTGILLDPGTGTTASLDLRSNATGSRETPVFFDFGTLTLGGSAGTNSRFLNVDRVSGLGSRAVLSFGALNTGSAPDVLVTGERGYSLQVGGATTLGASFTFNVRGTRVELMGGVADGTASFSLTKGDTGVLTLSGTGSYDGATTITGGTLVANHDDGAGNVDVFGSGAVSFSGTSSGALLISGERTLTKVIANSATGGNQVIGGLDAGTKTFSGGIAATRGVFLNAAQGSEVRFTGAVSGAGSVTVGGTSGILPGIAGTPPFGRGTVVLDPTGGGGNSFAGGLIINIGTVAGQAGASGSPFGGSSIAVNDGTLELRGRSGAASTTVNTALTVGGGANLTITDEADTFLTRFTVSTLARTGTGTVAVVPQLGTGEERFSITTAPALVNGILAPWMVQATSNANRAADFVTLAGSDVVAATYTSSNVDAAGNTSASVVTQSTSATLTGDRTAFALKLGGPGAVSLDLNAGSLNLGTLNAAGTFGGLILNNGAGITNGRLNFGLSEGLIYVDDAATSTISANVVGSGATSLTKFGAGTLLLTGNNSYRGATIVNRGTLRLGSAGALGNFTNPVGFSNVTVGANATLDLQTFTTEAGALAGDFGSIVMIGENTMLTVGRSNTSTTFSGTIMGATGSILRKTGTGRLTLDNTRAGSAASTLSELRVNQGAVQAVVTGQSNGSPFEVANSLPSNTLVTLRGGTFEVRVSADNSGSQQTLIAGNDVVVSQGNSTLDVNRLTSSDSNKLVLFGGLTLDRNELVINGGNAIIPRFTGAVTLNDNVRVNTNASDLVLDGVISDGGRGFTFNKVGGATLMLAGVSTYSGGTILTGGSLLFGSRGLDPIYTPGVTFVPSATARAGTGDIILNNTSTVRLNAPGNLAEGQVVRVISSPIGSQSQVDLRSDHSLAAYGLRTIGTGGLALGSGSSGGPFGVFSEPLNLGQIGDGTWGLSGSQDTIYTAATLGVGAGNIYRFGGSSSAVLALQNANVLTGTAAVEIGRSLVDVGTSIANYNALIRIFGDQDYTGRTTLFRTGSRGSHGARLDVRGTLASSVIENYGRFELNGDGRLTNAAGQQVNEYLARPGSSLRLDYDTGAGGFLFPNGLGEGGGNAGGTLNKWQDDLVMQLDGSQLNLVTANVLYSVERIGGLNYGGGAEIYLERRGTNGQPTLIIGGPLSRSGLGTLALRTNGTNELGAVPIAVGNGNTQRVIFANPADAPQRGVVLGGTADGATVAMVSPRFFEIAQSQFVDYAPTAVNGFTLVPFTSRNAAAFNAGGLNDGTEIIDHNTTAVSSVAAGADVWALRTSQNISGSNTITIRSGGLAVNTANNSSVTITAPVSFTNGGTPVEAAIWTNTGTGNLNLAGAVIATDLTKNGPGVLLLSGNNSGLTGTIQQNGGTLQLRNAASVANVSAIRLHGAYLNNDNTYAMPRLDLRNDTGVAGSASFAPAIIVSKNLPYAEITMDRFAGTTGNVTMTIPSLTVEGGGAGGTNLSFQNGNDFDLTVTGATTLGIDGSTSRVGFNVQSNNGTNRVTLAGQVSGTGSLTKTGNGVLQLQEITNGFTGGTVLNDGTLELANNTATMATTHLGTGAIDINRGTLRTVADLNNTNFASVNDLNVRGQMVLQLDRASGSGGITAILGGNSSTLRTFNSPNIQVNSGSGQVTGRWRGATVLNDNPVFFLNGSTLQLGDSSGADSISGLGRLVKTGSGTLNISSNAANPFAGGLDHFAGRINLLTASDTLGTGAVKLYPTASLHIASPANLTNPIDRFFINSTVQTQLGLRSNSGGTGFTSVAQVNALLGANAVTSLPGEGGLLVGDQSGGNFNWLSDFSQLGNGYWFIGSVVSNTNFTAGTFGAGAGNTYRLGGGGSNVYFNSAGTNAFLVDGTSANRVVIGKPHAFGASGVVYMNANANNSYSGGTTVSRVRDTNAGFTVASLFSQGGFSNANFGTGVLEVYGNVQFEGNQGSAVSDAGGNRNNFVFHPGARLIFENNTGYNVTANAQGRWGDVAPIALRGSGVELVGNSGANVYNSETVGAVSFEHGSEIRVSRRGTFGAELIISGALSRVDRGTLTINHDAGLLGINATGVTSSAANVTRLLVTDTAGLTAANGMVRPHIVSRADNQFLKYDVTNGFQLVTQGTPLVDYVASTAPTLDGNVSAKLLDGTAILSQDATTGVTLGANLDVHALRLQGDISSSGDLLSNQITIRSGGLTLAGGAQRTINANLVFGTGGTGEALIHATSNVLQINGQIAASSVTKFGTNFLNLLQDQDAFSGTWDLNQGGIQVLTPGALGTGEVVLHGWTGNSGQTQNELRFNFNPLSPEELTFTSGKITAIDQNLIRMASASDRVSRIASIDLKTTTAGDTSLAIPGLLRVQVDGARSLLRSGAVTMFDHYVIAVDAGSYGPGATTGFAPDSLNNAGTYDLTKIGDGALILGNNASTFTGAGRRLLVSEGSVKVTGNGSLGGAGVNAIIDHGAVLDVAVAGFSPMANLSMQPGAMERWSIDGARGSGYALGAGVHLQVSADQSGTRTVGLDGGSISGFVSQDVDQVALINTLGAGISVNLLADSYLGQPYPVAVNNVSFNSQHILYETGKGNLMNVPIDPRLQGGFLRVLGNITGAHDLTKIGQDWVLIGGSNSYEDTNVREGALLLGSGAALPAGRRVTLFTDAILDVNGYDASVGSLAGDSPLSRLANGATTINTLTVGSDDSSTSYAGTITGALALTKVGSGTLALTGAASTYVGPTVIESGVLSVATLGDGGTPGALGAATAAAGNLRLNGGTLRYTGAAATSDRRFTLGGAGGRLEASGTGALVFTSTAAIALDGAGSRTFTLGGSSVAENVLAAPLMDSVGASSLAKTGAATWKLTSTSTYTGPTSVDGGTLVIAGRLSSTDSISVSAGGSLLLDGPSLDRLNDAAPVTLSGGTLGFADSVSGAVENQASLTLSASSIIDFGAGAGGGNTLRFSTLSLGAAYLDVYNWSGTPYVVDQPDVGSIVDAQDRLLFSSAITAEQAVQVRFFAGEGTGFLGNGSPISFGGGYEIVPVPEPSATGLMVSAALFGLLGLRRRLAPGGR